MDSWFLISTGVKLTANYTDLALLCRTLGRLKESRITMMGFPGCYHLALEIAKPISSRQLPVLLQPQLLWSCIVAFLHVIGTSVMPFGISRRTRRRFGIFFGRSTPSFVSQAAMNNSGNFV